MKVYSIGNIEEYFSLLISQYAHCAQPQGSCYMSLPESNPAEINIMSGWNSRATGISMCSQTAI